MSLDTEPVVTTGIAAVGGLVLSVRLAGTDSGGGTEGRLEVGGITIEEVSSVAVAAPVFGGIEMGKVFVGCPPPTVSEALAENDGLAEDSVGGEESVAEGPGIDRPPGTPDDEADFSETRSVCAPRELSFAGKEALSADEAVWMPGEFSVNGGKSVAMDSPLIWGAFTVGVAVCAAREASVDSDTSVDPGTEV